VRSEPARILGDLLCSKRVPMNGEIPLAGSLLDSAGVGRNLRGWRIAVRASEIAPGKPYEYLALAYKQPLALDA